MKDLLPGDVARILRALDLTEFASSMSQLIIDYPSEARALILAEAGSRAYFVANPTEEEFFIEGSPRTSSTTVVTYGPTRGLLGDLLIELSNIAYSEAMEQVIREILRQFRRR